MIVNQLMMVFLFLWIIVYLVVSYVYYHSDSESSNSSGALKVYNSYRKFDETIINNDNSFIEKRKIPVSFEGQGKYISY